MAETKKYTNIPLLDKILNGEKLDTMTVSVGLDFKSVVKPLLVVMIGVIMAVAVAKVL